MADELPVKRINGQYQRFSATDTLATSIYSTFTPAASARALNSAAFQLSTTRPAFISYSVLITTAPLVGTVSGQVQLLIGATSGTATIVAATTSSGNNIIGTISQCVPLCVILPIGWFAKLVTTNVSGTPTYSITSQIEYTM